MTEPRNPLLVDIPPFEDEDVGGIGEMGNIPGLPDELQPSYFYKAIKRDFPYELYLSQVRDYWLQKFAEIPNPDAVHHKDKDGNPVTRLENAQMQAAAEFQKINNLMFFKPPVETLPRFAEVSRIVGHNVQSVYRNYVQDFMEEQDEIETERFINTQKLTGDLAKRYGPEAAESILRGYGNQGDYDKYFGMKARELAQDKYSMQSEEGRRKLADMVQKGFISSEEAFGRSQPLTGQFGEPIQETPTEWEQWQKGEAARLNQAEMQRRLRESPESLDQAGLIPLIKRAKSYGVDTSQIEGSLSAILQSPLETQTQYVTPLTDQITSQINQRNTDYGGYMSREYPDLFKQFQASPYSKQNAAFAGTPGLFTGWLNQRDEESGELSNTDFVKAWTAREAQRWGEYGDIYPTYRKYVRETGYGKADPFDTWLTKDPQAVAWNEDYQKRKTMEAAAAKRRTVGTGGIYRG